MFVLNLFFLKIDKIGNKFLYFLLNLLNYCFIFKRVYMLYLNIENMLQFIDICLKIVVIVNNYFMKV